MEWRTAEVTVPDVYISAVLDQKLGFLKKLVLDSHHQGRVTLRVLRVDSVSIQCAALEEVFNLRRHIK